MAFDVVFVGKARKWEIMGRITIGSFEESFCAMLDAMGVRDYMVQWIDAVERIERGGDRTAIVTCIRGLQNEVIGMWWVLFRMQGDRFAIHEQLILRDVVGDSFSPCRYQDVLPPYERMSDDGSPISEWYTTLSELKDFKGRVVERLKAVDASLGS